MALYSHPHFSLNTDKREVKDENGKLVRITGNPYRMLELLCRQHPASLTITDINVALDPAGAREYTEAHVRRMKNVVHTALGPDVIRYRNRVYSLIQKSTPKIDEWVSNDIFKKPCPIDPSQLQTISALTGPNFLYIHGKTPGGGEFDYINQNYNGKI